MTDTLLSLLTFMTALVAGLMLFYCIILGRFFDYLLRQGEVEVFTRYYAPFRKESGVVKIYGGVWGVQVLLALASLVTSSSWSKGQIDVGTVVALLAPLLLVTTHGLTGFSAAEGRVNSGVSDEHDRTLYLRLNLPLHLLHLVVYSLAALLLIF
jgi:hypothetical protein